MNMSFTRLLGFARTNATTCSKRVQLQRLSPLLHRKLCTSESAFELRKETFLDVFPKIENLLLTHPKLQIDEDVKVWIKKILNYNLKGGKLARGLTTVLSYEILEKPEYVTDQSIELSCVVGWCTEMAYLLMSDDIMDGAVTRRGIPAWYTLPEVGLRAINDSIIVYTTLNYALKSYIGHLPHYVDIMDLFNETLLLTSVGQHYDCSMAQRDKNDFSLFTVQRYDAIVKYKTSYYTYHLPVCAGMLLANTSNEKILKKAEQICLKIGRLFQMQDDYLDVYGSESVTGKSRTDIQAGKCSWLAVTALNLCNDAQRKMFTSSYGSSDSADIMKIKNLYEELNLPNIYRQEQMTRYHEVVNLVNHLDTSTKIPELFIKLLNDICNRNK